MSTATVLDLRNLRRGDLNELAAITSHPCVSIYLPTSPSGPETRQGAIRLRNLLDRACDQLSEAGYDPAFLQPLRAKQEDHSFWQHQSYGLCILATAEEIRLLRLPHEVEERVEIDEVPFLKPMLPTQASGGDCFVLTLTWEKANLYRLSEGALEPADASGFPASFDDLIVPRDPEEQLQYSSHRTSGDGSGTSTAMYHGQGEGEQKIEADRNHYLVRIAQLLQPAIYNTGTPLAVFATDEVAGHFDAASESHLDFRIAGSPANLTAEQVKKKVIETISHARSEQEVSSEDFSERFGTALAKAQATTDIEQVVSAALQGRVRSLLVAADAEIYGTIDESDQTARTSGDPNRGVELGNRAAIAALRSGAEVRRCVAGELPSNGRAAAAIFRF
ncbi:hypothetical protein FYK55_13780 [Roseiconus nitratireducens]|uniref:Uncharacterized protein n=1 Tax=Roseiconus nitratireducens TaxID=2605748 RepID=A0A5M6D534_9BACT|nr:hypothetical protein [Roseiconus nitratireducens]KAA5542601.1 hypothetical protein FYK55_13780 [Roseiconus nitratireducens]